MPIAEDYIRLPDGSLKLAVPKGTLQESPMAQVHSPANLASDRPFPNSGGEVGGLPRVNAAALQKEALRPGRPGLRFLPLLGQDGFLVIGFSHLLSGYPKTGKTELLVRLAWDWAAFHHSVLYITEEPCQIWEERLARLPQGGESVNLAFAFGSALNTLHHTIEEGEEQVIVVDTLRLLGLTDENDNAEINRVLTPLIALCRGRGKTLILAHHTRKSGGDYGTAAAGGHALVGVVDIALELHRDGQAANRRTLKGWGRVVQVPELTYELQDGKLVALGDPQEVALGEVKVRLQEVLTGEWRKTKELREALGEPRPSEDQVARALSQMAASGRVERDPPVGEGKRSGKTYQWRLNLTSDYKGKVIGGEVLAAVRGMPDDEEGEV